MIYQTYTGKGGLHGLNYADYDNYSTFRHAKQEIEQGQFFTPGNLVEWIVQFLSPAPHALVADLCCGSGAFFNSLPTEKNCYGCDIDADAVAVAKTLYPKAQIQHADIREYAPDVQFDVVVGNPPFGLMWEYNSISYRSEWFYCKKAYHLLKPAGLFAAIVPLSFGADDFTDAGLIRSLNSMYDFVAQIRLDSTVFRQMGVEQFDTKLLVLRKKSDYFPETLYQPDNIITQGNPTVQHNTFIRPIYQEQARLKGKLFLETLKCSAEEKNWNEKITKLLFDIGRIPKLKHYLPECHAYIKQYNTQQQPDGMSYAEWCKKKIHKEDVIKKLRGILRLQHPQKSTAGRLIKHRYSLSLDDTTIPIYRLVTENKYPFYNQQYRKLIARKHRQFSLQSQDMAQLPSNPFLSRWLDQFMLHSHPDGETIRLNPIQKIDINRCLQKPYAFLQWSQGGGKTIAGITQGIFRLRFCYTRNVFVVSNAFCIQNNWVQELKRFSIAFCNVRSPNDVRNIRPGQFVLLSFEMLRKYQQFIKKYIKIQSQKVMLILDESDNITNPASSNTKAVLDVFRRVRYKLAMTGTMTRNHIAESFSQLELLYNNSYNMMCESRVSLSRNKDDELEYETNPYFHRPIPPYMNGYRLFTSCHIPKRITVFGVEQYFQDIYNKDALYALINKTAITRSYQELTGKKPPKIQQVVCEMREAEYALYQKAMEKYYEMEHLFAKTGNRRKDAMLRIINQLTLLLRICAAPQTYREYQSREMPGKFLAVLNMLRSFQQSRVAIGVRHVAVAQQYYTIIRTYLPDRPLFFVTGAMPYPERLAIIDNMRKTTNGILIGTQQSFPSSVNIEFVEHCIIPEMHWNHSSMSQYYYRFCRYTSTTPLTVHFISYQQTVEANLLRLILSKEKLNLFMKGEELDDIEIYEKFGIDPALLQNLMYIEKTKFGPVLRWGQQMIC